MVKKYLGMFILMFTMILPVAVNAQISGSNVNMTAEETKNCEGDTCDIEVKIYLEPKNDGETITMATNETLTGDIAPGTRVTVNNFVGSGNFVATRDALDNSVEVKVSAETSFSEKTLLGTITYEYPVDAKDEECNLIFSLSGIVVETNPEVPQTGLSLPVIVLGLASIAGIGVYMVSRKNTKLFKI